MYKKRLSQPLLTTNLGASAMTTIWDRLEGVSVAGQYGLLECLGDAGGGAFFRTTIGRTHEQAILKLVPEARADAHLLEHWQNASRLTHPNLLRLIDCGQADVEGSSYLYAVFESPDDTLTGAAPLDEVQTREVLLAVIEALRHLHGNGLVHTSIDAAHIVAVGNQIKVSTDTVREPSREATTSDDVQAVGALLYHLLTAAQVVPGKPPALESLREPWQSIIRRCLDRDPNRRCTLAGIVEALSPRPQTPPATAAAAANGDASPRRASNVIPLPPPRTPAAAPAHAVARGFPKWTYVAALVFLGGLAYLFLPKSSAPPPTVQSAPAQQIPAAKPKPVPAEPAPAPAREARALSPREAPTQSAKVTPPEPPPARAASSEPREYWRVISYTYSRIRDAEHKARTINERWPEAQAAVFSPGGNGRSPYLVALGGRMTRDEAVRLLKIARGKGLPRDTYIQNYAQ